MRTLVAASAAVLAATPAWAQQGYRGYGWEHPMMGWGGPFAGILMFAAFIAVIVIAVLLVRYLWNLGHGQGAGPAGRPGSNREALEILDRRYAKGEIEREEYLRRKEDLQS